MRGALWGLVVWCGGWGLVTAAEPGTIRGAYFGWEAVLLDAGGSEAGIPASVERRVRLLRETGCNLAWVTNAPTDPERVAHLVRTARAAGVECVLGSGAWYVGGWNYARGTVPAAVLRESGERVAWRAGVVETQFGALRGLVEALPADARPWRWSLADEPPPEALPALRQLADRCKLAGIPTVCVVEPYNVERAAETVGPALAGFAADVYPFFGPGLPSNPPTGAAALRYAAGEHARAVRVSRAAVISPLVMVQGFQQWSGPAREEADGSLTFLPGAARQWVSPTAPRMRWQVNCGLASGARGAVVFAHGLAGEPWIPNPAAAPTGVSWAVSTVTPSGGPVALLSFPRHQPGPQHGATVAAFRRLEKLELLTGGGELPVEGVPTWSTVPAAGDLVSILRASNGRRFVVVVADPDQGRRSVRVQLPGVGSAAPVADSVGGSFASFWPWSAWFPGWIRPELTVSLEPGEAWIGELR